MPEYRVACHSCEPVKRWLWWCEDCAQDCQDKHLRELGHRTELVVSERWDGFTRLVAQSRWPRW